jgi:hypothetical protein
MKHLTAGRRHDEDNPLDCNGSCRVWVREHVARVVPHQSIARLVISSVTSKSYSGYSYRGARGSVSPRE